MDGNQEGYPDYSEELQKCKDFLAQYQVSHIKGHRSWRQEGIRCTSITLRTICVLDGCLPSIASSSINSRHCCQSPCSALMEVKGKGATPWREQQSPPGEGAARGTTHRLDYY